MIVSTTEIQNNFGKYLKLTQYEEVIITKNGKKEAKLVAYKEHEDEDSWIVEEGSKYSLKGTKIAYDEYVKITDESENRYEYIDGELLLQASPLYPHQKAVKEIFGELILWFKGEKCEPLVSPFDVTLFRLGNDEAINVVQPDILVICDPEKIDEQGKYKGVPTLVVEVLSDSTKSKDLIQKLDLYMESGINEYWVVNTFSAEIYVYGFADNLIEKILTFKGNERLESFTFQGLGVDLKQVFSPKKE